jgi:hypothetical protein
MTRTVPIEQVPAHARLLHRLNRLSGDGLGLARWDEVVGGGELESAGIAGAGLTMVRTP